MASQQHQEQSASGSRPPASATESVSSANQSAPAAQSASAVPAAQAIDKSDAGYAKDLKPRHIQMIAIGGSIGTGLFLGAGGRLAQGGAGLTIAYAVCGIFAFLMVRALGELAIRRPSSGAFVSYAREFLGEKGAYITGWLFFLDWSTTVMADITAVALYFHYWQAFKAVPQWVLALCALAAVFALNMLSVKAFGEAEFWFAAIKVFTILAFMAIAIWAIITGAPVGQYHAGMHNITDHGGFFPEGIAPVFALTLGVVFAFGGTEMVGVAAGEAVLELLLTERADGDTEVRQRALFRPRGLLGLLYWYGVLPLHNLVFAGMLRGIARAADARILEGPERLPDHRKSR